MALPRYYAETRVGKTYKTVAQSGKKANIRRRAVKLSQELGKVVDVYRRTTAGDFLVGAGHPEEGWREDV